MHTHYTYVAVTSKRHNNKKKRSQEIVAKNEAFHNRMNGTLVTVANDLIPSALSLRTRIEKSIKIDEEYDEEKNACEYEAIVRDVRFVIAFVINDSVFVIIIFDLMLVHIVRRILYCAFVHVYNVVVADFTVSTLVICLLMPCNQKWFERNSNKMKIRYIYYDFF